MLYFRLMSKLKHRVLQVIWMHKKWFDFSPLITRLFSITRVFYQVNFIVNRMHFYIGRLSRGLQKQLFILTIFFVSPFTLAGDYAIFTLNPDLSLISKSKAKMVFSGKIKSLKPIGDIRLMDWPQSSKERQEFYKKLMNKSPAQVNNKWASLAFSGRAIPPMTLSEPSAKVIKQWLLEYPKGIAYAPKYQVPDGANILLELR